MSPTLNVNPKLFVILCNSLGDYKFTVLQLLSLIKYFLIQISIIYNSKLSQGADKEKVGF